MAQKICIGRSQNSTHMNRMLPLKFTLRIAFCATKQEMRRMTPKKDKTYTKFSRDHRVSVNMGVWSSPSSDAPSPSLASPPTTGSWMTPSITVIRWNSPKATCTRLMIITRMFNLSRISRSVAEPDFPTFFEHLGKKQLNSAGSQFEERQRRNHPENVPEAGSTSYYARADQAPGHVPQGI